MDKIMDLVKFFQAHWLEISQAIAAIIGAASIIVKLTPSQKDDSFLLPIIRFLGKYVALNRDPTIDEEYRKNNPVK